MTAVDRIMARVTVDEGGCWNYPTLNANGYGIARAAGGSKLVHRVIYEARVGELIPGMQIDHLCFNKACCNPDHLEQVTPQENLRRRGGRVVETCRQGHTFDKFYGQKVCSICRKVSQRTFFERLRADPARYQEYLAKNKERLRLRREQARESA